MSFVVRTPCGPGEIKFRFRLISVLPLLLLLPILLKAQAYVEGGKTRHRFAQTTVGLDIIHGPSEGLKNYRSGAGGLVEKFEAPSLSQARLLIGGLHFWGHADFYLAIPVLRDKASPFRTGVETGAKVYPIPIRNNRLVPFAGLSFRENEYQLKEGPEIRWYTASLGAGLTFLNKAGVFECFAVYDLHKPSPYYVSKSRTAPVEFPRFQAGVSYKRIFDTTLSAEKQWKNGITQRMTDTLAVMNKLNGITIGAGPSSAFFLRQPSAQSEDSGYLGHHRNVPVLADLALGYYIHRPDMQLQFAYRSMQSRLKGYGSAETLRRTSLALEGYKFLFDYHGFCFFAGPSISREWWEIKRDLHRMNRKKEKIHPGVVVGWDIRPNRLQSFYLRTHLRWYPGMSFRNTAGQKVKMDQLEFNYIQLVIFPGRMF